MISLRFRCLVCALASPVLLWAAKGKIPSEILTPTLRQAPVDLAARLTHAPATAAPGPDLKSPFNPPEFDRPTPEEAKLAAAQIIDPSTLDADGRVVFGATVDLEDEDSGAKVTYQIVGEDEADLKLGLINISSPIARALIGKEEGDVASVQAPGGVKKYEIIKVSYI